MRRSLRGILIPGIVATGMTLPAVPAPAADGPSSNPHDLYRVGSTIFFRADDGVHGDELWTTSATKASTRLVKDIYPGPDGSRPESSARIAIGSAFYFLASTPDHCDALWRTDGTSAGTKRVSDLTAGCDHIYDFAALGSTFYFLTDGGGLSPEF